MNISNTGIERNASNVGFYKGNDDKSLKIY